MELVLYRLPCNLRTDYSPKHDSQAGFPANPLQLSSLLQLTSNIVVLQKLEWFVSYSSIEITRAMIVLHASPSMK